MEGSKLTKRGTDRSSEIVGGYLRPVGGKKAKATGIRKIGRREDVVQGKLEGTLLTPKG